MNSARLEELETRSATLRERLIPDEHLQPDAPPIEPTPAPAETPAGDGADEAGADGLLLGVEEAEYRALVGSLSRHERDVVAALLADHDASLEGIAEAAGIPATLLVDRVNEKALEAIGDVLIDTTGGTPAVFEEHAEVLAPLRHPNCA